MSSIPTMPASSRGDRRCEFSRLDGRMRARRLSGFYFTIITFHELMMGANLYISKAKDEAGLTRGYRLMDEILAQFKPAQVLSFDEPSARIYGDLRDQKIRIGKMDLRIGSIVLSHKMTLLTRNASDFEQIPSLLVEDWTK